MRLGNGKTQGDISASHSPATTLWGRLGRQLSIRMRCLSVYLCNMCTSLECSICRNVLCMCMGSLHVHAWMLELLLLLLLFLRASIKKLSSINVKKSQMCNCSFYIHDKVRTWCHFCLKEAKRNWGIIRTASREEVDHAGVAGFTNYLRTAEEITWGWILCHTHYIFTQHSYTVRPTLSTKYHVAVV